MSNYAPAAAQAVRLITLLAEEPEAIGISELSRRLETNKNMVSRLLNTLEAEGWVYCEREAKYRLTLRPFQVASRMVGRLSLSTVAAPLLYGLWQRCQESTYLGILKGQEVLYIVHHDSLKDVRVAGVVGGTYPLYCTAPGKVLLAYSEEAFIDEYLEAGGFEQRTPHTLTTPAALREELDAVRTRGYATDNEEFGSGIVCLAAPVFDREGAAAGVVGCSLSTVSCPPEALDSRIGGAVRETAAAISRQLGAPCA